MWIVLRNIYQGTSSAGWYRGQWSGVHRHGYGYMKYNSGSWITRHGYRYLVHSTILVVGVHRHGYGYIQYNSGSWGTQTWIRIHEVQIRWSGYTDTDTGILSTIQVVEVRRHGYADRWSTIQVVGLQRYGYGYIKYNSGSWVTETRIRVH